MKRYLFAGAFFAVLSPRSGRAVLCGLRSREPQMHDDAQPTRGTHEEHGRPLQDGSRGPQGHGQHERVRRLKIRNSSTYRGLNSSAAEVGDLSHEVTSLAAEISNDPLRETRLAGRAPGFFANCATYGSRSCNLIRELLTHLGVMAAHPGAFGISSSTQFFGSFLTELPLTGMPGQP